MESQQSTDVTFSKIKMDSAEMKMTEHIDAHVADYYKGRKVFITGASGFIGKVLIEKLLRSCPEIEKIYILMRPKKSQDIHQRTCSLLRFKLFDQLRKIQPHFEEKIIPVKGDIALPDIGLSQSDRTLLEDEVDIIFHSAATVRFDEPLRLSVEMNVVGVQKMIDFAKKVKHLQAFVHVSTAYSNCDQPFIEETVYPAILEPQKLIDALKWMDDQVIDVITPHLLGTKPNTYIYTKHLGETLLWKEGAGLPTAIVRPSIVGAAWKEPLPGWIDNYNGAGGLCVAVGTGILRSLKGEQDAIADIVPVDVTVNLLITSAWYTAVHKPNKMMIYNCTTGSVNPYTWGQIETIVQEILIRTPYERCFRCPKFKLTNNSFLHDFWIFMSHKIPAHACDLTLQIIGKRPRMVKLYDKLHKMMDLLSYFTSNSWQWRYSNLEMLKENLRPDDLETFFFDPRPLHWPTYVETYCLGTKQYLLNEDLSRLPAARAHIKKLQILGYVFNILVAVGLWRLLAAKSSLARSAWHFIVRLVFSLLRFLGITGAKKIS